METTRGLVGTARAWTVAGVLVIGVGVVVAAPGSSAEARGEIRWHHCGRHLPPALQRGKLAVPLDYRHPHAATIRLGFNRLRASERKHRVGSLIVNPGGRAAPAAMWWQWRRQARIRRSWRCTGA